MRPRASQGEAPRARKWDGVYTLIKQRWPAPGVSELA